jgi:pimeloyl-ACP methyl ester carboxylesterase
MTAAIWRDHATGQPTTRSLIAYNHRLTMRYARAYPNELPQLAERFPEINAPVLIIASRRDRVVALSNAESLGDRLPNGKVVVEAEHLVWEERADEYASLIADWIAGGYRAAAARGSTVAVMSPATD